jgi:uncharacterized protein
VKVVLAGGSGALGARLADDLAERGDQVVILTRTPRPGPHRQVQWDGRTVGDWARELDQAAVVNLAGELVDRRPTARNIALLRSSRVEPTLALAAAARTLAEPVPVWVQASTLAIHGDSGEAELDESSAPADGPPQMAGVASVQSSCEPGSSWIATHPPSTGWRDWRGGASEAASATAANGSAGSISPTGSRLCG